MWTKQRVIWLRSAPLLLAVLLSLVLAGGSFAACTNDPDAAQKAASFLDNTASLLNGPGGPRTAAEITDDVRDFVAANPQALSAVIALLKAGGISPDQQKALGTGLGLAAGVCLRPDPTFAAEIQTQIASTDSADAKQAYAAVTGNQLIGSVGGGGGGGSSGAAGGSTNPIFTSGNNFSNPSVFTSNSVSNTPSTNLFSSNVSGASSSTPGSITNTVTTNTVTTCVISKTC